MDTTTNNANLGFLRGEIEKRIATANKTKRGMTVAKYTMIVSVGGRASLGKRKR